MAIDTGAFEGVDDATAALILQGYLEDSKQLFEESQARSKNRQGVLSDYQVALQVHQKQMERGTVILQDRQMSKSITRAVLTDAQVLAASQAQDQLAMEDRRVACQLGGVAPPLAIQAAPGTQNNPVPISDRDLDIMEVLFVREPSPKPGEDWAMEGAPGSGERPLLTCIVCQEESRFFEACPVKCEHPYCRECLQDLFNRSFKDESLFPPKCCGEVIDPDAARLFLTKEIMVRYERRKIELDDPKRTYCAVKTCSAYIPHENIRNDCSICPECSAFTCALCQSAWHSGACPTDNGLQLVLANAEREGWKRCPSCRAMVDLTVGCNHITCRCSYEFCYECTAKWKTCECPTWEENRLLEEGRRRAARDQDEPGPVVNHGQVAAQIARIQRQHHCDHPRFVYRPGKHTCDRCGDFYRKFGYKCTECNLSRCATCRFNR